MFLKISFKYIAKRFYDLVGKKSSKELYTSISSMNGNDSMIRLF